ncbi:MAG: pyridoxal phosphate-dependent decarboxylase family protein [Leptonema sp. (in: bacteria)]
MLLPKKGLNPKQLFNFFQETEKADTKWNSGKLFGYVFDPTEKYRKFPEKILLKYYHKSGLDFTVFPSLLKIEQEIIDFSIRHLNGDENCCGSFTSGGTESILLAVKTARDYTLSKKNIKEPEILLPITAHPAFHKAARYFGLKTKLISLNKDLKVNLQELEQSINQNTIMIVGSAPSYTYGILDPIPDMAQIAKKYGLFFHVDACMGGFFLPFLKKLNIAIPNFDFSIEGVSSISMDFHKFAYAPKGSSVILYRNKEIRKYQIFSCANWIGYTMINPTIQSTKSGGPLAATYATLMLIGEDGYIKLIKKKLEALKKIQNFIKNHKDLTLISEHPIPLLAFTSNTINIFHIVDEMNLKGWYIQPVLSYENFKESIHLTINYSNVSRIDEFLIDLEASIEKAKQLPSNTLLEKLKSFMDQIQKNQINIENLVQEVIKKLEMKPNELPKRFAPINEFLNILPIELREQILLEYVNFIL